MLIIFIMAVIGMTSIIVDGSIFDFIRDRLPNKIQELFSCYQCTGFWVGVFFSLLLCDTLYLIFALGCAGSAIAHTWHIIINWIYQHTPFDPQKFLKNKKNSDEK